MIVVTFWGTGTSDLSPFFATSLSLFVASCFSVFTPVCCGRARTNRLLRKAYALQVGELSTFCAGVFRSSGFQKNLGLIIQFVCFAMWWYVMVVLISTWFGKSSYPNVRGDVSLVPTHWRTTLNVFTGFTRSLEATWNVKKCEESVQISSLDSMTIISSRETIFRFLIQFQNSASLMFIAFFRSYFHIKVDL